MCLIRIEAASQAIPFGMHLVSASPMGIYHCSEAVDTEHMQAKGIKPRTIVTVLLAGTYGV